MSERGLNSQDHLRLICIYILWLHDQFNVFHHELRTCLNPSLVFGINAVAHLYQRMGHVDLPYKTVPNDLAVCFDHSGSFELGHFNLSPLPGLGM